MKIAYFGTPSFSAALLEKLILDTSLGIKVSLVVTQPDRPTGRKMLMTPSPVKTVAQKYGIEVVDSIEKLQVASYKLREVDLSLVYAFGFKRLIPLDLLRAPKIQFDIGGGNTSGFVNIHPSLLPLYRGASPIAYPILMGENKTGVTLFVMDEKMDHGPIISQEEMPITLTDVRTDMEKKLSDLGFEMLKQFLISTNLTNSNQLQLIQQEHSRATRAPYMTREDGFIDMNTLKKALKNEPLILQDLPYSLKQAKDADSSTWHARLPIIPKHSARTSLLYRGEDASEQKNIQNVLQNSAMTIFNFWRGMHPWPGVWTKVVVNNEEKRLKIINMSLPAPHQPTITRQLRIDTVQLEGKSPIDFPTFQRAYKVFE